MGSIQEMMSFSQSPFHRNHSTSRKALGITSFLVLSVMSCSGVGEKNELFRWMGGRATWGHLECLYWISL